MTTFRISLVLSTIAIYAVTLIATFNFGINWPAVALQDLVALNWRSQFDIDFLIYLFLASTWIIWREGGTTLGYAFAFLNVFLGGMFTFPYLLFSSFKENGDPTKILLGVNATQDGIGDCDPRGSVN